MYLLSSSKTQLFLHSIVRHLLRKKLTDHAIFFAQAYEHLPYFNHALEVLVHQVLEEESDSGIGFAEGMLTRQSINQNCTLPASCFKGLYFLVLSSF
jgi:hypothetical protein